ncbi:hypothetical protein V6N13_097638 [Hibiscus sabdariffa]
MKKQNTCKYTLTNAITIGFIIKYKLDYTSNPKLKRSYQTNPIYIGLMKKGIFVNRWCNGESDETTKELLKKIADMSLEDYPYEILEGINVTWDQWNSPESLVSNNSMNLDETKEENLANAQES